MSKVMFGGGWFWCIEELLRKINGVVKTEAGYSGGHFENPTYKDVCTDKTGHVEVVLVEYNQEYVTFKELLKLFFDNHNPTDLNRQGEDIGTQYRSVIYCYTDEQMNEAVEYINKLRLSKKYSKPIVTEIKMAGKFFRAEEYHQHYLEKQTKRSEI